MKKKLKITHGIKSTAYGESPQKKQRPVSTEKINICLNCEKANCAGNCEKLARI